MSFLEQLFSVVNLQANVFHNGQYCGDWAIDTSGSHYINFHIVTRGSCYLTMPTFVETPILLSTGDILLLPRDNQHCLMSDNEQTDININEAESISFSQGNLPSSTGITCGYFLNENPFIHQIIAHLPDYIIVRQTSQNATTFNTLMAALISESTTPNKGSTFILGRIAEVLFALLLRDHISAESGVLAANLHPKLSLSLTKFHEKPEDEWRVETLAKVSAMSRSSYSDLFKKITAMTPMEYITQWRIAMAYQKLLNEQCSVLEAALDCGYNSESAFSKAFKRILGISPSAVNKKAR